ncbi:MAG: hypothetical protein RLZZ522_157 [Verrucomicrobiota bacterium]|jgi:hypothetical protein
MHPVPSITSFKQWLRAAASEAPPACSIVLHGAPPALRARLAVGLAAYLNEYDDDGNGRWLAVPPELVPLIADDPTHRYLLGLGVEAETSLPDSPFGMQQTLTAMAERGYVVLDSPLAAAATQRLKNVFHVGLGLPPEGLAECHIILNPALFHGSCLPQIVGDVFLEWLNFEGMRTTMLREI